MGAIGQIVDDYLFNLVKSSLPADYKGVDAFQKTMDGVMKRQTKSYHGIKDNLSVGYKSDLYLPKIKGLIEGKSDQRLEDDFKEDEFSQTIISYLEKGIPYHSCAHIAFDVERKLCKYIAVITRQQMIYGCYDLIRILAFNSGKDLVMDRNKAVKRITQLNLKQIMGE